MKSLGAFLVGAATVAVLCGFTQARSPSAPEFLEVRIESHPKDWGYAHKTVRKDRSITGGHMSGGPGATHIFETTMTFSDEDWVELSRLLTLAASFSPHSAPPSGQSEEGFRSVIIVTSVTSDLKFHAAWTTNFKAPEIQAIWELLYKYKVGAW